MFIYLHKQLLSILSYLLKLSTMLFQFQDGKLSLCMYSTFQCWNDWRDIKIPKNSCSTHYWKTEEGATMEQKLLEFLQSKNRRIWNELEGNQRQSWALHPIRRLLTLFNTYPLMKVIPNFLFIQNQFWTVYYYFCRIIS